MAKKATRPEMSWVESRQQYRKRVVINGVSHDVWGRTKPEVRAKVKELGQRIEKKANAWKQIPLVALIREWLPVKTANLTYKSADAYVNAVNNHIAPFFGNMLLTEVKPFDIQRFMATKANLSRSSQSKILFTLKQVFDTAEQNGYIDKNPCKGIKAHGEPSQPKTPLTTGQQKHITQAVGGTRAELFVLLCLYAGLRREEALGLQWDNVSLKGTPYINVRHTVTFGDGGKPIYSTKLKSRAAYRTIPTPAILTNALRKAKETAASAFVVPAVNSGGEMSLIAFRRLWDIVKRAVGNEYHVTPHILRHTYLTELCAAGMDIKKIQYLAGHEDVAMTLRIYAHVKDNAPEELAGLIEGVFA
ncbi:MAG: site-specific integrase [Oscillospiraceae bacterium]|jgi:integrase|nr:site-specific integrase [Oscillospiraceae bacterium]